MAASAVILTRVRYAAIPAPARMAVIPEGTLTEPTIEAETMVRAGTTPDVATMEVAVTMADIMAAATGMALDSDQASTAVPTHTPHRYAARQAFMTRPGFSTTILVVPFRHTATKSSLFRGNF